MNIIHYRTPKVSTWSSFDRFSMLRGELDRLFDFSRPDGHATGAWTPALDVHEDKEKYLVSLELPGLKKEEIGVSLHEGVLTVSGERKREGEHRDGDTFRSERSFGKFERRVTLPAPMNSSSVKASYKDGILAIELPKAEEAKPKQIAVSVS